MFADLTPYGDGPTGRSTATLTDDLVGRLHAVKGTSSVVAVRGVPGGSDFDFTGVVSCRDLARLTVLGHCATASPTAVVSRDLTSHRDRPAPGPHSRWPASSVSQTELASLPVDLVIVSTDGSHAALETTRTLLESAYGSDALPETITESEASQNNAKLDAEYRQLVDVVVLCSMVVAGCSLAVSVATGLTDRRRPFSLLRLSGAPLSVLRRVLLLESVVPLLVVSAVSVGVGFLAAYLFLRAQLSEQLQWPHESYYVVVLVGLLVALAVTVSTLPLLPRMTGPEAARNE